MKCEHCGRNEATFFCRSTVNGRTSEVHLCAECAAQLGYAGQLRQSMRSRFFDPFSLLSDFGMMPMRMLTEFPAPVEEEQAPLYAMEQDAPAQGTLVSAAEQAQLQRQRERNALETQLQSALAEERYEDAARLRDELRKLPSD